MEPIVHTGMHTIAQAVFVAGMLAAAGSDLRRRRVPNRLNLAILAAGLGARALDGGIGSVGLGALGAALGLALLIVPFAARWIGAGDVKLVAAIGAWLGPAALVPALLLGLVGGGLVAAAMAVAGGAALRAEVFGNVKAALVTMNAPHAPRRRRAQLVPLALPLGAAALLVFFGGFHG